jgi:hypothetical protein
VAGSASGLQRSFCGTLNAMDSEERLKRSIGQHFATALRSVLDVPPTRLLD